MLYLGENCGLMNSYQISATHSPPGPLQSGSNNHFINNYCHSFFDFVTSLVKRLGMYSWWVLMDFVDIIL